jgi:hypothetical protein
MSTMTATATATPATAKPATPKAPTSASIKLTKGSQEMVITARTTKAGATSDVTIYKAKPVKGQKRTGERGGTTEHANLAAAKAHIEEVAAKLTKAGWQRPVRAAGYARKPDVFSLGDLLKGSSKK